jgi:integral membrane protein
MYQKELKTFKLLAQLEGWSFIALMLIAMPLKYIVGIPLFVKIAGPIHGLLFIAYVLSLVSTSQKCKFSARLNIEAFVAAFLPFGTIWLRKNRLDNI